MSMDTKEFVPFGEGWVGVDLDGTVAEYHGWIEDGGIGPPVPRMVDRIRYWLTAGIEVRIVTARVSSKVPEPIREKQRKRIEVWCLRHIGRALPVTSEKDFGMIELWDDRAVHVLRNTGLTEEEALHTVLGDVVKS